MTNSNSTISYITLGVTDITKMEQFYTSFGFKLYSRGESTHPFAMYKSGSLVLALYPKDLLAKQAGCEISNQDGNSAMSVSLNVARKVQVEKLLSKAKQLGAEVTREGFEPDWGGYSGYFKDPEENLWEIVWNEKFVFTE